VARFFHPLILMLAGLSRSELARQIQYLKADNEILMARLPKRVTVTPAERRRLLNLGRRIGPAIKHLVTIVTYRTFLRWLAGDTAGTGPRRRGRPRADEKVREIIVRLAKENGYQPFALGAGQAAISAAVDSAAHEPGCQQPRIS
jgi:putative transposase